MKFYNIKIGTHTRAGNFNALQSFVAQSDKTQSSIYSYYSNKYKGFNVLVEEIIEIIKDEIPIVTNNSYNEFSKTPNELEIDRLNNIMLTQNIENNEKNRTIKVIKPSRLFDFITKINELDI